MYKVYRDPEGKSAIPTQHVVTTMYRFQCSEDIYREQIEKLRKEISDLKNRVSVAS